MQDFIKVIEGIDWDLLHNQKQELLKIVWEKDNDKIEGLVNLLDELQDVASKLRMWEFPSERHKENDERSGE